jgi:hypothetical protein
MNIIISFILYFLVFAGLPAAIRVRSDRAGKWWEAQFLAELRCFDFFLDEGIYKPQNKSAVS